MGNIGLGNQVTIWIAREKEREAKLVGNPSKKTLKQFLNEQRAKFIEAFTKETADKENAESATEFAIKPAAEEQAESETEFQEVPEAEDLTRDLPTTLTVGDNLQVLLSPGTKLTLQATPTKPRKVCKPWTDYMLKQFLQLFIQLADDPLARPEDTHTRAKAVYRRQVPEHGTLYQDSEIYLDNGEKKKIRDCAAPDTLHSFLGFRGLSGQKSWGHGLGLVHIIDHVMAGEAIRSKERLLKVQDQVIGLAESLSKC